MSYCDDLFSSSFLLWAVRCCTTAIASFCHTPPFDDDHDDGSRAAIVRPRTLWHGNLPANSPAEKVEDQMRIDGMRAKNLPSFDTIEGYSVGESAKAAPTNCYDHICQPNVTQCLSSPAATTLVLDMRRP